MDASGLSQWSSQLHPFDMPFETPGHLVYPPGQAQLEQGAMAQVYAELPAPDADFLNGSELSMAPPGSLPTGVDAWAGVMAQTHQFPPQAAIESYTNVGFVQQPVQTQRHTILQRAFGTRRTFAPQHQQPMAPQQPMIPQRPMISQPFPVLQQPIAPQQLLALRQRLALQQAVASQQFFVPQSPAPQQPMAHQQPVAPQQPMAPQQFPALQRPVAPQQLLALQQRLALQQAVASQQLFVPQSPAPQQPMAPQQFPALQQPIAPQQLLALQQAVASQQLFAPQQPAPPTTAAIAPATAAAPQALAIPPANPSSKPLSSKIGAVHVFEANVQYNKERVSSGLRTWRQIASAIVKGQKNPTKMPANFVTRWEETLVYMSQQDFQAYCYKQRKLARGHNTPLPPLSEGIAKFSSSDKAKMKDQSPITARAAAQIFLKKSRGPASSGSRNKGRGEARATPYPSTSAPVRPSPLGN